MADIGLRGREETPASITAEELEVLQRIERRVLWLATRIVDYANRERPSTDALKVGGHQASSASMVSMMTALYLWDLEAADRVSVKPHASPTLHAIEYLMGRLDRRYLTMLREFGGLQSYPSRTKDEFPVDYSTGSVGIGSTSPLFGALADRYVEDHFGRGTGGRFISFLGDAELDEGNVWEAVIEPQTRELGNALWVVDLNRQSLDRVVPIIKAAELQQQFETTGWQVIELKYGRRLRRAYASDGGELLRRRIDEMPNQLYQSLFAASEEVVTEALLDTLSAHEKSSLEAVLEPYRGAVGPLIQDLGGHDLADLLGAYEVARLEPDRPTIVFAYTVKGWGLPMAGHPLNHSALMTAEAIDELREATGLTAATEWDAFGPGSPEGELCAAAARRLERPPRAARAPVSVPATISTRDVAGSSTQAAVGRALLDLSRHEGLAERIVTVSPDVSVSTNLGGWIHKVGVYGAEEEPLYDDDDASLTWKVGPTGRHIELGISEMNLFLALGQLGLTWDFQGEQLFPIGALYDPFVIRGLEGMLYGAYAGARFVVLGTPSGISLSREGGAHQSTITPGIGMELPGVVYAEPTYGRELEWILLDHLRSMQEPDGDSLYLRLSTKPVDQEPFTSVVDARGVEAVRADVLAGAFWLREYGRGSAEDEVILATTGAITPEVLAAADLLETESVSASVLQVSSPDRLYRDWRARRLTHVGDLAATRSPSHIERLVPASRRGAPVVTIIDGASHALAFLGACLGTRVAPLGVDRFGQVGSLADVYAAYDLSPEAIATAALIALEP